MINHGHFYWNELMTSNVEQAKAFYHDTLGWEFQPMPMEPGGTYWLVPGEPNPICGMFEMSGEQFDGMSDHWLSYIAVDDVDQRVEKARSSGATIAREPWDIPGIGRIAMIQEPGGATIGWMTPAQDD
jgi:predicted enzyme related to lactoylglutathione lyase